MILNAPSVRNAVMHQLVLTIYSDLSLWLLSPFIDLSDVDLPKPTRPSYIFIYIAYIDGLHNFSNMTKFLVTSVIKYQCVHSGSTVFYQHIIPTGILGFCKDFNIINLSLYTDFFNRTDLVFKAEFRYSPRDNSKFNPLRT